MKITIYELLKKIKDGEAPKKIKINENILNLRIGKGTSYEFETGGGMLSFDYYIENNKLDTIVEVIEKQKEDKKIERITNKAFFNSPFGELVGGKFNEIIDAINEMRKDK